ncbi:uracil-DNA glycosylase [Rhodocytophaga rosea]|uniref:Uracil-DNA glycosylase n=1 Tax=Rhodocytophaga rosea TaxID=2704465 RepID=A0A6C0GQX8_9BACT|nr:uracil-DNA glycosylase [Rhodocytophaga rosea]QHT69910.1 uracil-DNA glycosylase [Rhodocytophaga rosea]
MDIKIENSWKQRLALEFEKTYFQNLITFVKQEYATQTVYPPGSKIFYAFDACPFDQVKVVIIGQDPYHGAGQAHGLAFSVNDGVTKPPSLINIFKELHDDLGKPVPKSGNLSRWAEQGVLLLNATLTVRANTPGSHQGKGWEEFTDAAIKALSNEKSGIVFLLWGAYAQKKGAIVDAKKHYVLKAKHPSPMAAKYGGWFGTKHFSQTNEYLRSQGKPEIDW